MMIKLLLYPFISFLVLNCLYGTSNGEVTGNLEQITVVIDPSWQMHAEYKQLLTLENGQQSGGPPFQLEMYKFGEVPIKTFRDGIWRGKNEWMFKNIPDYWLENSGNQPSKVPFLVLDIKFPVIHLTDGTAHEHYQPKIKRYFYIKKEKQYYLVSILESDMHVLQWSADDNVIMERGKQLLEPEDAASKPASEERERLEKEMRKFEAEIHGQGSQQPAMKAPNTKADLEAEIARNTEETSMDEMRALQGPYEARVRKLLRLHRNNLLYRNLLGMLSGEEKESKEQLKKYNWERTLRLVKLLKEMEKELIKKKFGSAETNPGPNRAGPSAQPGYDLASADSNRAGPSTQPNAKPAEPILPAIRPNHFHFVLPIQNAPNVAQPVRRSLTVPASAVFKDTVLVQKALASIEDEQSSPFSSKSNSPTLRGQKLENPRQDPLQLSHLLPHPLTSPLGAKSPSTIRRINHPPPNVQMQTLLRHKQLTPAMGPSETAGDEEDAIFVREHRRIPTNSELKPPMQMLRSFSAQPTAAAQRNESTQAASRQNQNAMPGNIAKLASLPPQHPHSLLYQIMDKGTSTGSHSPSIISNVPGGISHPKSSSNPSGTQRSFSNQQNLNQRQLSAEQLGGKAPIQQNPLPNIQNPAVASPITIAKPSPFQGIQALPNTKQIPVGIPIQNAPPQRRKHSPTGRSNSNEHAVAQQQQDDEDVIYYAEPISMVPPNQPATTTNEANPMRMPKLDHMGQSADEYLRKKPKYKIVYGRKRGHKEISESSSGMENPHKRGTDGKKAEDAVKRAKLESGHENATDSEKKQ